MQLVASCILTVYYLPPFSQLFILERMREIISLSYCMCPYCVKKDVENERQVCLYLSIHPSIHPSIHLLTNYLFSILIIRHTEHKITIVH
uniref:Uncharacterized protein n=1 Tax=Sinocyclocheilus anshuiensis TaxID=1608454 RepID=A0A671K4M6_9TELE